MMLKGGRRDHYHRDGIRVFTRRVYIDEPPHDGEHQTMELHIGDVIVSIATRDEHVGFESTSLLVWNTVTGQDIVSNGFATAIDIARACADALKSLEEKEKER